MVSAKVQAVFDANPVFAKWIEKRRKRSEATVRTYVSGASRIIWGDHFDSESFVPDSAIDKFLTLPKNERRKIVNRYIDAGIESGITADAIGTGLNSIKSFYQNDENYDQSQDLNWRKIFAEELPEGTRSATGEDSDYAPDQDQVAKFISLSSFRLKVITLLLTSSGMRAGALETLRYGDYSKFTIDGITIGVLIVYRGTGSEYYAFVSPEAMEYLDQYLAIRKTAGEVLFDESRGINAPLIRDSFEFDEKVREKNFQKKMRRVGVVDDADPLIATPVKQEILFVSYNRIWAKTGLRVRLNSDKPDAKPRYNFHALHCFRKFTETQLIGAKVTDVMVKRLLGQSTGLSKNYWKTNRIGSEGFKTLAREFIAHLDALAITDTYRVKPEIQRQKDALAKIQEFLGLDGLSPEAVSEGLGELVKKNNVLTGAIDHPPDTSKVHLSSKYFPEKDSRYFPEKKVTPNLDPEVYIMRAETKDLGGTLNSYKAQGYRVHQMDPEVVVMRLAN